MDKFEELMSHWPTMSEDQRKKIDQENQDRCNCPPCPTYAECAKEKGELVFCMRDKSSCIKEMKQCYCPDCPVHQQYNLRFMFYCVRGNESDRRGARSKK